MKTPNLKGYKGAILIFLTYYILSGLISAILYFTLSETLLENNPNSVGILKIIANLIVLITLLLFNKKQNYLNWEQNQFEYHVNPIILILVLIICLRIFVDPIIRFNEIFTYSDLSDLKKPVTNIVYNNYYKDIILFTNIVILSPIIEEIIFRGYILKSMKNTKTIMAILFSSLLFTSIHFLYSINNLIVIFIFAIIASIISLKLNLKYAIIFHCLYNFFWYILDNVYFNNYLLILESLNFNYIYWVILLIITIILFLIIKKIYSYEDLK